MIILFWSFHVITFPNENKQQDLRVVFRFFFHMLFQPKDKMVEIQTMINTEQTQRFGSKRQGN